VEEAFIHFDSMKNEYGIDPGFEQYMGLLGVLGKCGHLNEAVEFVGRLPFEPTAGVWDALRNYARIHGDVDLEDRAKEIMVVIISLPHHQKSVLQSACLMGKTESLSLEIQLSTRMMKS
jgi:hypothetical protein